MGQRASLGDRLLDVRRRGFVGRTGELARFSSFLQAPVPSVAVLHVHGPGGVGKSSLLGQFVDVAREHGRDPVLLDGRALEPTPEGVAGALAQAMGDADADAIAALASRPRTVLLVDTYEQLAGLDGWMRHTLLPRLREDVLVVLAGRNPPDAGWRSDPGWQDLVDEMALRDLPPDGARALLAARGVPADRHAEALAVARGHPLALVLVAEVLAQRPDGEVFSLGSAPDVIQLLLRRFVGEVTGPAHREALLACAHAGEASEALLRDVVDAAASGALFRWLCDLSFSELRPDGVALHAVVADALDADARWRDPDGYAQLHHRVSRHLDRRVAAATGRDQQRAMWQKIRLLRFSPMARDFYDFDADGHVWLEAPTPEDHDAIVDMTVLHEGPASGEVARWWLARQPGAFRVFRTSTTRRPTGFVAHVELGDTPGDEIDADPVLGAVWQHVRAAGPVRPGERIVITRFWVDEATHQQVATHHLVSSSASMAWVSTPALAWAVTVVHEPDVWEPIFAFIDFQRVPDLAVAIGEHRVGLFARDWRTTSVSAWIDLVAQRQLSQASRTPDLPSGRDELVVLSQEEFARAVRDALRGLARPGGLDGNPLMRSRVVVDHPDGAHRGAGLAAAGGGRRAGRPPPGRAHAAGVAARLPRPGADPGGRGRAARPAFEHLPTPPDRGRRTRGHVAVGAGTPRPSGTGLTEPVNTRRAMRGCSTDSGGSTRVATRKNAAATTGSLPATRRTRSR